jgi:hypothetical protein
MRVRDTDPKIARQYRERLMALPGEERLRKGCSMFDSAVEIVRSSLVNGNPAITPRETRIGIFRRLYGSDYNEAEQAKIIASWEKR